MSAGLSLSSEFRGRRAAIVLPMAVCDARGCTIPAGADVDPCALVARELDAVFGNTAATREFDFWPLNLPADKGPPGENTIAFSVSRDWSQRIAQDLIDARLVGQTLDALPLAIARAVELGSPGAPQSPVAAVDWGCARATLCAVLGHRPVFVRCLRDAGFATVLQALCERLSVNQDEAHKLLTDYGLPDRQRSVPEELQTVIEELTAEPLNRFVEELHRTLAFLRQQRRTLTPQKLVLFGGGAAIRNVAPYLSAKVELPVEPWGMEFLENTAGAGRAVPLELLGPAIALSSLAWSSA